MMTYTLIVAYPIWKSISVLFLQNFKDFIVFLYLIKLPVYYNQHKSQ